MAPIDGPKVPPPVPLRVVKATCPHCGSETYLCNSKHYTVVNKFSLMQNPTTRLWERRIVFPPHECLVIDAP